MLRVIQLNTLEDRSVHDKQHWDGAIRLVLKSVRRSACLVLHDQFMTIVTPERSYKVGLVCPSSIGLPVSTYIRLVR